jgi:hypothetical protein
MGEVTYILPATEHTGSEKVCALLLGELVLARRILNRVVQEELPVLRHELLQLPVDEERPRLGPSGALAGERIAPFTEKQDARGNEGEPGVHVRSETVDEGLAETVEEAEIYGIPLDRRSVIFERVSLRSRPCSDPGRAFATTRWVSVIIGFDLEVTSQPWSWAKRSSI